MRTFSDFCIVLLKTYQRLIAPILIFLGVRCRFEPSCSHYAISSIKMHGPFVGAGLSMQRLLRCQPLCSGGYDPVPTSIRFLGRPQKNG